MGGVLQVVGRNLLDVPGRIEADVHLRHDRWMFASRAAPEAVAPRQGTIRGSRIIRRTEQLDDRGLVGEGSTVDARQVDAGGAPDEVQFTIAGGLDGLIDQVRRENLLQLCGYRRPRRT